MTDRDDPLKPTTAHVKSIGRGFDVLRAFGPESPRMSLTDVSRAADISRAAARRFLLTLEELGYVRSDGREFALAPRALELGNRYLSTLPFLKAVKGRIRELSSEVHESTGTSVLDGTDIVVISRVSHLRLVSVSLALGARFPAVATATGRVLLAALGDDEVDDILERSGRVALTPRTVADHGFVRDEIDRAREQGWAAVDGEVELGLMSVSTAVRDANGVVCAINTATSAHRESLDRFVDRVLEPTLNTAKLIAEDLSAVH